MHEKILQVLDQEEARLGSLQLALHERRRPHPQDPAPGALRYGQCPGRLVSSFGLTHTQQCDVR